jgi:hypothetical protein
MRRPIRILFASVVAAAAGCGGGSATPPAACDAGLVPAAACSAGYRGTVAAPAGCLYGAPLSAAGSTFALELPGGNPLLTLTVPGQGVFTFRSTAVHPRADGTFDLGGTFTGTSPATSGSFTGRLVYLGRALAFEHATVDGTGCASMAVLAGTSPP